jgi:hypothetical protein
METIGEMSSNSTEMIAALFRDLIVPMARSTQDARLEFAPKLADGSYFDSPRRPILTRENLAQTGSMDELSMLEAIWRSRGYGELVKIIPPLADIARQLATEASAQDEKSQPPSTLIYQMY